MTYARREVGTLGEEKLGYSCTLGLKPSYLCPVGPRTTDVPHPGASTLISAPQSKQLGHQGRYRATKAGHSMYQCINKLMIKVKILSELEKNNILYVQKCSERKKLHTIYVSNHNFCCKTNYFSPNHIKVKHINIIL